jgi:hypothetical protein
MFLLRYEYVDVKSNSSYLYRWANFFWPARMSPFEWPQQSKLSASFGAHEPNELLPRAFAVAAV